MTYIFNFIKKNTVLCIAIICAIVSVFFVGIDKEYLNYIDLKTIFNLFVMMLVIAGLKNMRFFVYLATLIITKLKTSKKIIYALVFITFIASMFLANDMALLTFLPLTLSVFSLAEKPKYCAFTIIMQNIGANLGGMILPFGNPQSLYMYSFFGISTGEFVSIMWLPFVISVALISLICFFVKDEPMQVIHKEENKIKRVNLIIYTVFFIASLLSVLRILNFYVVTIIVAILMLFLDKKSFKKVDYSLLFTFIAFFIFASNMARITAINNLIKPLVQKNTLLTGVLSCQVFSNVPTAIFLSKFTLNYKQLLLAVNIGGAGTPIASLASLISLGHYKKQYPQSLGRYLALFLILNFSFLIVLTLICYFFV